MGSQMMPIPRCMPAFTAGAILFTAWLAGAASAQGIELPSSLTGLGASTSSKPASSGGDAFPTSGLGNLSGVGNAGTWSTPSLPEQRPVFGAVDESTYVVGPGDHFHIGTGVRFFSVVVGPEGYLVVEGAPPIRVEGLVLRDARARILDALSRHYKRESLHVRLSQAKRFQILVAGAVNGPGLHVMEPGARASNALEAAGGYSVHAARDLMLVRADGKTETVDLRGFYLDGDLSRNPLLRQGDRLVAPALEAGKPAIGVREGAHVIRVPLHEGETYEEFILRYDGYRAVRPWTSVRVFGDDGKLQAVIPRDEASSRPVAPGAVLEIQSAKAQVFIGGMVVRPGAFDYNPTMTAMDYLALSGITVNTSDVRRIRVLGADGTKRKVNVARDPLRPGDHILVPRSFEAAFRDHIMIISAISSLAVAIATFVVLTGE